MCMARISSMASLIWAWVTPRDLPISLQSFWSLCRASTSLKDLPVIFAYMAAWPISRKSSLSSMAFFTSDCFTPKVSATCLAASSAFISTLGCWPGIFCPAIGVGGMRCPSGVSAWADMVPRPPPKSTAPAKIPVSIFFFIAFISFTPFLKQ